MALDYSIITLLGSARAAGPARPRKWHRDLSASPRSESRGCCPSSSPLEDHRVLPARLPVAAEPGYALALVNWIYDSSFQMSAKAQATTGRFLTTPNPENSTRCAHLSARCALWRCCTQGNRQPQGGRPDRDISSLVTRTQNVQQPSPREVAVSPCSNPACGRGCCTSLRAAPFRRVPKTLSESES